MKHSFTNYVLEHKSLDGAYFPVDLENLDEEYFIYLLGNETECADYIITKVD